jgi:RNA polymerase sigma-70 factor (ECF subfamily)
MLGIGQGWRVHVAVRGPGHTIYLASRDREAFSDLYRPTSAKLYAVALRILRRRDWAEEVLQDSFVKIWNHIDNYSADQGAPMTWMMANVRNRALDLPRRPTLEHGCDDYDVLAESMSDSAAGPERLLENSQEARSLAQCLDRLSANQRQCITLAYLHGLLHAELAAHLREPLGTVKTWIRRGLEHLRVCLESVPGEV